MLLRNCQGLTLVELVVVIVIIGILSSIIAPNAVASIEKSRVAATLADFQAIKGGVLAYYGDTGKWPQSNEQGKDPGLATKDSTSGWNGPYIDRWVEKCPLGNQYSYNRGQNIPNGLNMDSKYKFITITGIATSARDRLERELDGTISANAGVVRYGGSDDNWTVYLIISEH
ncbi:type II secretion system protein GspG [Desulforamulus aquiferis]|uniref:Type II secretion system protein GspG n=1 Tax=Desulforamulus aquiferis TaxID=1397668 RepID=A0AAW7ZG21_9FIRM|nr:type II secretion system protein GspG [Desulforamulus aquiferis]MDO7788663.1 type II secretion system protein GspG [Desulforamulus aquiferis]RYD06839.1 hypothetical protein N752_02090 [Desulforamulus aquiferis]